MSTFRRADKEAVTMMRELVIENYKPLEEAKVSISVMFAHAKKNEEGESKGPALKCNGWPAMAMAEVISQKCRADGLCDARIIIDGDQWEDWPDPQRKAIIDHELNHFEVVKDKEGNIVLDDSCRPRIKIRAHDWQFGGFNIIADRHGDESEEEKFRAFVNTQLDQKLLTYA